MDFKTFLENFDAIAEAPGGIPKLRSLILDLAVRGKLVPQNPQEETALELFQKIESSQKQLLKEGKITSHKRLSTFPVGEAPFEVPDAWKWLKLGQVVDLISGKGFKASEYSKTGIRLCQIANVTFGVTKWEVINYLPTDYLIKYPELVLQSGDVLIALNRPLLNRRMKVTILNEADTPSILYQRVGKFIFYGAHIETRYFFYYLHSNLFIDALESKLQGSDQPFINKSNLIQFAFPLPPLAEQKRIVEKVDELMGLCDRYEAAKQTRDKLRQKLRESAIASLMKAETDEELDAAWAFAHDNWHNLSQKPEDISSLRKTVLELAVRGKLVPQDSKDCEAKYEIEEIVKRTKELESSGQLSKQKKPLPLSNQLPYSIPQTWSWARFVRVASIESNLVKPDNFLDSPHIAPNYIEKATGRLLLYQTVAADNVTSPKHLFYPGQIIYSKIRPNLNKVTIVDFKGLCSADMYPISTGLYPRYLLLFMLSQPFVNQVTSGDNRLAMPKVNQEQLSQVLVAVPPLAEQKRIVAKVHELMQLCDQLEASLRQSQQQAESLAASAISHLTI
jgi:type I restriction enzyme S subunit